MSEEADESQKTEEPTLRKIEQARERGTVPSSRDLNTWIMLIAGTIVFAVLMPKMMFEITSVRLKIE